MLEEHLTPDRVTRIVRDKKIAIHELEHVRKCSHCNGWLRAFAAMASVAGKTIAFEIPPPPPT